MITDNLINRKPKVSVCVVAYNHECFLRDCLESIVNQAVDFEFEVLVGDDASTDNTRQIIQEFVERYPNIVAGVYHKVNIGSTNNYISVHSRAQGDYIAHVDGDDLMLPGKLQAQADYLDNDENCNVVWHQVTFFSELGDSCVMPQENSSVLDMKLYTRDLLLCGSVAAHSSTMYRARQYFLHLPTNEELIDWYVLVRLLGEGYGIVLRENLGKYRLHQGGLSNGAKPTLKMRKFFCDGQLKMLDLYPQYSKEIAARALMTTLLDAASLRKSCMLSLNVFLKAKSLPRFKDIGVLKKLYFANRRSA